MNDDSDFNSLLLLPIILITHYHSSDSGCLSKVDESRYGFALHMLFPNFSYLHFAFIKPQNEKNEFDNYANYFFCRHNSGTVFCLALFGNERAGKTTGARICFSHAKHEPRNPKPGILPVLFWLPCFVTGQCIYKLQAGANACLWVNPVGNHFLYSRGNAGYHG